MILAELFGPCALCKTAVPAIARTKGGIPLCLPHWRIYVREADLSPEDAAQPEDRQRLLELGEQVGYPEIQISPSMRLLPGLQNYARFCRWHDNPADTHQAVKSLEAKASEKAEKACGGLKASWLPVIA